MVTRSRASFKQMACRHRLVGSAILGALLSACGGGLYVGWSETGADAPPSVNLASTSKTAHVGEVVHLIAAASDDYSISRVEFYRIELDGRSTYLGSDGWPPYDWDTPLPDTSASSVRYYARAIDDIGQSSTSALISVTTLR